MILKTVDFKVDKLYTIASYMYQSDAVTSVVWSVNSNPYAISYIDTMKIMLMKDVKDATKFDKRSVNSE